MNGVPKRVWVILAVSVALNLFCFGLFASRYAGPFRGRMRDRDAHEHERGGGGPGDGQRGFLKRAGLRDAGPDVQAILRDHRGEIRENMHALVDSRNRVRETLRSEPLDAARLKADFAQVREQTAAMQADMHEVLNELAGKLNADQRKRMANALWRGHGEPQAL